LLGGVMDPQPAYALGRGLKTLPLRVARHNANAMAVAQFLETHPRVERVFYPGLPSHPDHAIAARQMSGFGGMVCVEVAGGQEGAYRAFDRLQVIRLRACAACPSSHRSSAFRMMNSSLRGSRAA
jgi:cystathionine beta-lyase/cystathionine gamma-synthase